MRILWSIHLYPPVHNCGAEYVAHNVNKYLLTKGHEIRVLLHQDHGQQKMYELEGVQVFTVPDTRGSDAMMDQYNWGDILCTHLDYSQHTVHMGRILKKPVIHFIHNSFSRPSIEQATRKQYVVYNSDWVKKSLGYKHDAITLYPPCPISEYRVENRKKNFITMINCDENKGGFLLYRLAKEMPEENFLAVKGSYDWGGLAPEILELLKTCSNVSIVNHSNSVKEIYKETKILLALSRYESWGRVATEAMINGIPVIACPTPGLLENCGDAALWVPARESAVKEKETDEVLSHDGFTYDIKPVKWHIEKLRKESYYAAISFASIRRANCLEIERINHMYELEKFINYAKQDYKDHCNAVVNVTV